MPALRVLERLAWPLGLLAAYVGTARLGLALDPVGGFATLVWPPTGIALAALARRGRQLWPAVMAAALVANLWSGAPLLAAAAIGAGNALEAALGATLLSRSAGFRGPLDRLRHARALLAAALASPIVSASLGVFSLWAVGTVPSEAAAGMWLAWWLGDVLGALVVAPALLNVSGGPAPSGGRSRAIEALLLAAAVLASAALSFSGDPQAPLRRPHMVFPALIWAALRFRPAVAALAVLAIAAIAIAVTTLGTGHYAVGATLHENLTAVQGFMGTVALTGIFLGAANAERGAALELLADEHARLNAIALSTSDSLAIKDLQGRYLLVNPAHARVLGASPEAVVGKSDADFLPPDVAQHLRDSDRRAAAVEGGVLSEEVIPIGGEPRTFSSAKAPYRVAGEVLGNISISRDITRQKNHERELEQALGQRDEFLSIASHELRTPLAALSLQVAALLRVLQRRGGGSEESQRELYRAGRAMAQVERLIRVVDNLFDVSQITAGRLRLDLEAFDLSETAAAVAAGLTEQAARAGCCVNVATPGAVIGQWDRFRIEQVITNLLTNAFKYGAGSPIDLRVEADEHTARLRVIDRGLGIEPDASERIFERFERAADEQHGKSLGVGLYIARQVVDAHAGRIRVEASSSSGTTFLVELPRRAPGPPSASPPPRSAT